MGASKRICELYVQNLNQRSKTEFVAVRFGNFLGSSGSVIPKFIEQINKGGPVTVTHPEVTRYFMLISEAVQLVLQAASLGNGGEIFILNMGKPVRIAEMAEDLIFLAGREPHKDVRIEFTGLRHGEKLYEELLVDETEKKTQYENITIGRATHVDWDELNQKIATLQTVASQHQREDIVKAVKTIVPEYQPSLHEKETPTIVPFRRSH
jgi:FlaA1/EpsC-like NDP-sugar epimerase